MNDAGDLLRQHPQAAHLLLLLGVREMRPNAATGRGGIASTSGFTSPPFLDARVVGLRRVRGSFALAARCSGQ